MVKCLNCGHVYTKGHKWKGSGGGNNKTVKSCGKCTKLFSDSERERIIRESELS